MSTQLSLAGADRAASAPFNPVTLPTLTGQITYGEVITVVEDKLRAQLEADGKSLKRIGNFRTAINGWMKTFELTEQSPVGVEFGSEFNNHMECYATVLGAEGKVAQTISDRRSMVRAYREEWILKLESVAACRLEGSFGQSLRKLIEESGLSVAGVAREVGIDKDMLWRWRNEKGLPTRNFLDVIHRLEGLFGLPCGALAARLPKILRGDIGRIQTGLTGYRKHLGEVTQLQYILKEFQPVLQSEWKKLFSFYTDAAWLRTQGLQRNSRWRIREHDNSCPTAECIHRYISEFMGFLVLPVSDKEPHQGGKGMAPEELTLALLSDSDLVYSFLQFKKERTFLKRYNSATHTILCLCLMLLRPGTGFLWQLPEFGSVLPRPVPEAEWHKWCERNRAVIKSTLKDLIKEGEIKKTRDPFEPIRSIIVNNQHPLDVLFELADAYEADAPPLNARAVSRAAHYQNLFLTKFATLIPLRAFNLSVMTWRADGTGNLYQKSDRTWWIRFEPTYMKNHKGAAKDTPFEVPLHPSLWPYVEEFLFVHRPHLLGASACDYVFRPAISLKANRKKDLSRPVSCGYISTQVFKITQRYIADSPGFGIHAFRHLVATEYIKNNPAGYAVAAAVLHDREETVRKNYAWVLPADKFNFWNLYVDALLKKLVEEKQAVEAEVSK